jgi:DNA-binding response OmpR family regulator
MQQAGLSIVERDTQFGVELAEYLGNQGFPAILVPDLANLLQTIERRPPSLVLLGEGGSGALAALRRLRAVSRVPCIVLASRPDEASQIVTLEAGADDFVERSQPPRAILARIRAVLRRCEPLEMNAILPHLASVPCWRLQPQHRRLLRPDGSECDLTTAEFDLLRLLVDANGQPVCRDDISATVFRRRFRIEDCTVDNLVLRLRRKLGPQQERAIKTVRGAGYMFAGFVDVPLQVI